MKVRLSKWYVLYTIPIVMHERGLHGSKSLDSTRKEPVENLTEPNMHKSILKKGRPDLRTTPEQPDATQTDPRIIRLDPKCGQNKQTKWEREHKCQVIRSINKQTCWERAAI